MQSDRLQQQIYRLLLIVSLVFLINGCSYSVSSPDYPEPLPLPEKTLASYSYPKYQGDYQSRHLATTPHYRLQQITFPSNHTTLALQHDITIDYYAIDAAGKSPIVVVLPIFGGNNNIASIFARYFTKHGFATAIVHRQSRYKQMGYMQHTEKIMRQIVFDHKQAIDWIESRPELDASRIAVFGVSMGGIKSALISALDPRVSTSVIALAAGDLPYILTHTNERTIQKEREGFIRERDLSPQELHHELAGRIECDPINYAQYIDASKTLMILARFDRTVPFHKGVELREKIGNPETIYLLAGHYSSVIFLPYVKYQSRKFLQRKLLQTAP